MEALALPMSSLAGNFKGEIFGQVLARLTTARFVVSKNVPNYAATGFLWRKGDLLERDRPTLTAKLQQLAGAAPADYQLDLIEIHEGDLTEDEAGIRLAELVAGPGINRHAPIESRVNLHAKQRGLLKIDIARLDALNEIDGVAVFTLLNDMAVEAGREVAGAKVVPLVYPASRFGEIAQKCEDGPIVDVLPFQKRRIAVLYREMLQTKVRDRFVQAVQKKLAWFGAELLGIESVRDNASELTQKFVEYRDRGAELILHVGGHSSDPLDPIWPTLHRLGAQLERHGAPAHPGTLFWLAYLPNQQYGETAVFGLASCGMFSETTLGDIFLAKFCAGERVTNQDIARMGYGGLFSRDMAFRFPPYD